MEEEDAIIYLDMINGDQITITTKDKDFGITMDAIISIKDAGASLDCSSMSYFDATCKGDKVWIIDTSHISSIRVPSS